MSRDSTSNQYLSSYPPGDAAGIVYSMKTVRTQPVYYVIRVEGCLSEQWAEWFDGLAITRVSGETLLSGPLEDQAALYGVLKKVRDLGLALVSVNQKTVKQ